MCVRSYFVGRQEIARISTAGRAIGRATRKLGASGGACCERAKYVSRMLINVAGNGIRQSLVGFRGGRRQSGSRSSGACCLLRFELAATATTKSQRACFERQRKVLIFARS